MSPEGKKAFEAAFKAHAKKHLTVDLPKRLEDLHKRLEARRAVQNTQVRDLRKANKFPKAAIAQTKLGRSDRALAQIGRIRERAAAKAKSL